MLRPSTAVLIALTLAGCMRDPVGSGEPEDIAFMKNTDVITENMRKIAEEPGPGSRDLALEDVLMVQGFPDAIRVYDIGNPRRLHILNEIHLTGGTGSLSLYNRFAHASTTSGIRVFDLADPSNPTLRALYSNLCGSARHTLVAPENSTAGFIFSAPHSTAPSCTGQFNLAAFARTDPELASVAMLPLPRSTDCDSFSAHAEEDLLVALCENGPSGGPEAEVWNIADPFNPQVLFSRAAPSGQSWHSASFSADGVLIALGTSSGETQVFLSPDISASALASFQIPVRGAGGQGCEGAFTTGASDPWYLVQGCQASGTSVLSIRNESGNVRIAEDGWAIPSVQNSADVWASYWYDSAIYTSDQARGLEIFRFTGAPIGRYPKGRTARSNPRTTG